MEHLDMQTPDGNQLNLDALYKICPACFTESKDKEGRLKRVVDWDKLRALLGDNAVEDAPEVYDFTWVGKRAAQREAARPINKTLRPCPEESVDWDTTHNLYIEGDNLEVLKLLQNSYMGKVKMIYIDPPYNTGNDFVYHDDFAQTAEEYDEHNVDEDGNRFRKNTDSNGRFHSDWCSMMYSRLMVARSLLREDGVIFISIDDNEQRNLKCISDEIFGEVNFLAQVVWERAYSPINLMKHFSPSHDYILCFAKNVEKLICNGIPRTGEADGRYSNPDNDPRGVWKPSDLSVGPAVQENVYTITTPSGRNVEPPAGRSWSLSRKAFRERLADNRIWFGPNGDSVPSMKRFLSELRKTGITPMTYWRYDSVGHSQEATQSLTKLFDGEKVFDYPKPLELIKRSLSLYTDEDSIVLDFFSGSATTAHAIFELNATNGKKMQFILVQLKELTAEDSVAGKSGFSDICELAQERIRRAGKKIKEEHPEAKDLDVGFRVFKCDSSNMKDVYFAPKELQQSMLDFMEDNIKENRSDLDLLFDCMLRWGVELSLPMTQEVVDDCTIHNVNDGDLVACFAGKITDKVIAAIAAHHPLRVVFRDSSFSDSSQKMNLFEQFKQLLSWTDQEVRNNVKVI